MHNFHALSKEVTEVSISKLISARDRVLKYSGVSKSEPTWQRLQGSMSAYHSLLWLFHYKNRILQSKAIVLRNLHAFRASMTKHKNN